MTEQRFKVVFAGELVAGQDESQVRQRLEALFKAPPERIARLFDGRSHVVKSDVDEATAQRYQQTLHKAGALVQLEAMNAAKEVVAEAAASGELSLAPVGSLVIEEGEVTRPQPVQVSTDHISLAEASTLPPQGDVAPAEVPDTSHISIAEVGADVLAEAPPAPVSVAPDTSGLSIAEAGSRLQEAPQSEPIATPDTSGLSLAPEGSPLEQLKDDRAPLRPDISGLSLAPNDDG